MGFVIILVVGLSIAYWVGSRSEIRRAKKGLLRKASAEAGFKPTWQHVGADGRSMISVDETQKAVLLIDRPPRKSADPVARRVPYRALVSAEIVESTVQTSSKVNPRATVRKIELCLVVDDPRAPSFNLCFLDRNTAKTNPYYSQTINAAREWHARIAVLAKAADAPQAGH